MEIPTNTESYVSCSQSGKILLSSSSLHVRFHLYPDKKWYTFVETDTYMFWATMLQFQASLDHTKPYHMGSQNWIGDDAFAHGGSGFVVSNPALRLFVGYYATH